MKMIDRIQENLNPWWGRIITTLMSAVAILVSVCVYFLIRINDKIDYSYQHAMQQKMINQEIVKDQAAMEVRVYENEKKFEILSEKMNNRMYELRSEIRAHHERN